VDAAFGETFAVRHEGLLLHLQQTSFGVVREIFGRECYCSAAELKSCRRILDLGANAGVFGLFALVSTPEATVQLVEAQSKLMPALRDNMLRNGFTDRVEFENALVGGEHNEWTRLLRMRQPELRDFSITDYLARTGECDYLKCDIEGAEYAFFGGDLSWLAKVRRIALEYHGSWGQGRRLGERLHAAGHTVKQSPHGKFGYLHTARI
jgi:FkbM family methyltransferase